MTIIKDWRVPDRIGNMTRCTCRMSAGVCTVHQGCTCRVVDVGDNVHPPRLEVDRACPVHCP
jgi:hypothetical protein